VQSPIARKILKIIRNGSWQSLKDIADTLKTSIDDVKDEVNALSQFGILVYNEEASKIRLSPWVLDLEERGKPAGRKSAVGSIILPPEGQVAIQNIVISNFLDKPVELGIRADTKLKEISISKVE
jgi:hypothetical protein